jgi:DNA-binding response OmpR family regulator
VGQRLDLSVNEYGVLEALMTAAPATQHRRPPGEGLGRERDPFTKTVYVTVGRLRRTLGEPDIIETVPRVG